jgi:cell division septum initiation protein DivIVA
LDDLETDLATARAEARTKRFDPGPQEAAPAAQGADPFEALGSRVAEVLRTAEEHARRVREEAEASADRMLGEAREESDRMRSRASEEADTVRQTAMAQAEAVRRMAQDEADRVREDAATALESARVEAERTVAGLSERRSALTAELHATKARLMGIVSQLEEESQEDPFDPPESALRAHGIGASGSIPSDDPRRDPVPPDLPSFAPPPAPPRVSIPEERTDRVDDMVEIAGLDDAHSTDVASDVMSGDPAAGESAEVASDADGPEIAATTGEAWIVEADETSIADSADPTDEPEASAEPEDSAPGPADGPAERESFLHWTDEESESPALDMSLPEFPSIDIPSLEDEERRRD